MKQKVVIITGSSRGIGLEIAKRLNSLGYSIVLNGTNEKKLREVAFDFPNSLPIAADVTSERGAEHLVSAALQRYGKIDGVVCNVGGGRSVRPGEETLEEWQRIFALNFWSTTNVVEAVKPALAKTKGSIVCISSICGLSVIKDAPVTYSTAKAALNTYVRSISHHLGKFDIRINAIAPGNIFFDGSTWDQKLKADEEVVQNMLKEKVALQKFGTPEDVANLVEYFLSSKSSFASGAIWTLDGGQT